MFTFAFVTAFCALIIFSNYSALIKTGYVSERF